MNVTDLPLYPDFPFALPEGITARIWKDNRCAVLSAGEGPSMRCAYVPLKNTKGMSFDRVYGDAVRALQASYKD